MISTDSASITRRPRYVEVAARLRAQIATAELTPGQRLPSFVQMRARGISQNTMEKVYALLEAEGLIERATGSGIYVAQAGRVQPRERTGVIGLPGRPDGYAESAYGGLLLSGLRDAAYDAGYDVLMTRDFDVSRLAKMDGAIWIGPGWEALKRRLPMDMPWVSLLWLADAPSLLVDEEQGVRLAMQHLLGLGHRRIAYLTLPGLRLAEYYPESLQEAGIQPNPLWTRQLCKYLEFDRALGFAGHGYQAMTQWLDDDWRELGCTAILAHNDETAVGVLRALREAGLRVPSDVSVIGFDGTSTAFHADPPLTTIEVPLREIGGQGARTLLRLIENREMPSDPNPKFLSVGLRIGGSTAPPT